MIERRTFLAATGASLLAAPALAKPSAYWPGAASWETLTPAQAGLDAARLNAGLDGVMAEKSVSAMVLRGGKIVAERYAAGTTADSSFEIASAGKSMLSVLTGICIDQGKMKSVEQSASDFIPQWKGTPKEAIKIRHLLSMTSGLEFQGLAVRNVAGDQFMINAAAKQLAEPGTVWAYSTPVYHLMFHVVARAAGEKFETFAQRNLLDPVGMTHTTWLTNQGQGANGPVTNYYTAKCSARDLARFGLMALRGGKAGDKRVVSEAYLKAATSPSQKLNGSYGYLWWENAEPGHGAGGAVGKSELRFEGSPRDLFAALGAGGQIVVVVPSLDLVIIRQGMPPGGKALETYVARVCEAATKA